MNATKLECFVDWLRKEIRENGDKNVTIDCVDDNSITGFIDGEELDLVWNSAEYAWVNCPVAAE